MRKALITFGAAVFATLASVPAHASTFLFELTGSRNATFTLDSNPTPDSFSSSFIGDQFAFNNVSGTFGGTPGTASVSFGNNLIAALNINSGSLDFTQFVGPALFTGTAASPMFNLGTFNLTSIVSGSSTLTISQAATGAVPDPATWAMMLIGFGAIGWASRRRTSENLRYA